MVVNLYVIVIVGVFFSLWFVAQSLMAISLNIYFISFLIYLFIRSFTRSVAPHNRWYVWVGMLISVVAVMLTSALVVRALGRGGPTSVAHHIWAYYSITFSQSESRTLHSKPARVWTAMALSKSVISATIVSAHKKNIMGNVFTCRDGFPSR